MRIGVIGRDGRMGVLLAEEIVAAGATLSGGVGRDGDVAALAAGSEVVIEFAAAAAVPAHAAAIAAAGVGWVLGTSGLAAADEAAVAATGRIVPVVYAANFATGAVVALAIAERLARALPAAAYDAEIVEMHHRQKVDAPSGTALALGAAVARGRGVALASVRESGRDGLVGVRPTGAIGFASLRGGQVVGEHTVLFAGASEQVSLGHRAFDRRAFATGAVRAAMWIGAGRVPGVYGMEDVLELR